MVIDPISNFIIQIKNASIAGHDSLSAPYSTLKEQIAQVLIKGGYVKSATKKGKKVKKILELTLPNINAKRAKDVKRISKSSRRVYIGASDLKKLKREEGLTVISTPKGIFSVNDAITQNVGGEVMFNIK